MKSIILFCFFALSYLSTFAQKAEVIKLDALQNILNSREDTTFIVNFMATWCKPCIEELPHFEKVSQEHKNEKVKFFYVSLDPVQDLDKKLNKLITKKNISNKVFLLDETDPNVWINKIEKRWDGAIPVTIVFNNPQNIREFFPKTFTEEELNSVVKKYSKL